MGLTWSDIAGVEQNGCTEAVNNIWLIVELWASNLNWNCVRMRRVHKKLFIFHWKWKWKNINILPTKQPIFDFLLLFLLTHYSFITFLLTVWENEGIFYYRWKSQNMERERKCLAEIEHLLNGKVVKLAGSNFFVDPKIVLGSIKRMTNSQKTIKCVLQKFCSKTKPVVLHGQTETIRFLWRNHVF